MAVNIPGVVKWQKVLLGVILLYIVLLAVNSVTRVTGVFGVPENAETISPSEALAVFVWLGLGLAILVGAVVAVAGLTRALGWNVALRILCCVLLFVPLVGLITLLVVNSKATSALKAAGYRVGLMGVKGSPTAGGPVA